MNRAKYILRGLGVGIVVTAVLMGIYTRQAVADARVKVLKEYGIGEEAKIVEPEVIPFGDGTPQQTTELNGEADTEMAAESAAETGTAAPETTAEPEMETKPEAETKTEIAAKPEAETKTETAAKAEAQTKTETKAETQTKTETKAEAQTKTEAKAETQTKTEAKTEAQTQKNPETEKNAAESKSAAESAAKAETKTDNNKAITIVIVSGDDSGTVARKLHNAGLVANAAEFDAFLMQHGYDKRINTGTKTFNRDDSWQKIAEKITR